MSFSQITLVDGNLHKSIDLQQMIILELESALQDLNDQRSLEIVVQKAMMHALQCASLLHEARKEYNESEDLSDYRTRLK
jgi:hypothetical protein